MLKFLKNPLRALLALALLVAAAVPSWDMLRVNQLKGFNVGGAALSPFALTYQTATSDTTDLSTYTFSSPIGTAPTGADVRIVAVGFALRDAAGANHTLTSVTIQGITATTIAGGSGTGSIAGIAYASVPTGTTADVVITIGSGPAAGASIAVWSITNPTGSAPTANVTDTTVSSGALNLGLTVPSGGAAIASVVFQSTTLPTWSGATINSRQSVDVGNSGSSSQADTTDTGSITLDATVSGATTARGVSAAWGP